MKIELKTRNGKTIINFDHVRCFYGVMEGKTEIVYTNGDEVYCDIDYDRLMKLIADIEKDVYKPV